MLLYKFRDTNGYPALNWTELGNTAMQGWSGLSGTFQYTAVYCSILVYTGISLAVLSQSQYTGIYQHGIYSIYQIPYQYTSIYHHHHASLLIQQ